MAKYEATGLLLTRKSGLGAFLQDFADSFRAGWEAADRRAQSRARWNAVHIRSRGWNSELKELQKRYERLRELHSGTLLADEGWVQQFQFKCMREVFATRGGALPPEPLLDAIISATTTLTDDEVFFSFPHIDWSVPLTLEEGVALRRYLDRKERFLSRPLEMIEWWATTYVNIWTGIFNYIPEAALAPTDQESSPLSLSASTSDVMANAGEAIERLIGTMFDHELTEHDLFEGLRERLEDNLYTASGIPPGTDVSSAKKIVLPTQSSLNSAALVDAYLSETPFQEFFAAELPITIPTRARFEHCHIVGGSGHGKTQLLQLLIHHDLVAARGDGPSIVVVDSQGDLIRTISHLSYFSPEIEESLAEKFMLVDPNDIEFPVALNMFDVNLERIDSFPALEREKILNGTIELYEYIFGALLGAELTQKQGLIFRYLARLMMVIPGATIHTLRELLEDGSRFSEHFKKLEGTSRQFFETDFLSKQFQATKQQALRRLWGVLSNPTFERMFSHPRNKVDLFDAMNSGKIILINTAKDLLKQEGCEIFGRFFIAMIAQAALQRAAIPEEERRDTFVYIDEAHDYFDDNIENLLNQARKYRVGLTLAHQNLDQLSQSLRASIMASTSIKLVGGMSAKDARTFAPDMRTTPEFLQSMRKWRDHTEFACFIKNETPQALKVSVGLGAVNMLPRIADEEYQELLNSNREAYCALPADHEPAGTEQAASSFSEPDGDVQLPVSPTSAADTTEHRRIQTILKKTAQQCNFGSNIECQVLDGSGSVDVVIETGALRIGCEISITTKPDHELQNVEKCLRAGFDQVWIIASASDHLSALRATIESGLVSDQLSQLCFFSPQEAIERIRSLAPPEPPKPSRVFGYDVTVEHCFLEGSEGERRRAKINELLSPTGLLQSFRSSDNKRQSP